MGLFRYTYGNGRTVTADTVPADDAGISELIFVRYGGAGWGDIRPHMSHPAHEAAAAALPPALRVLRADGCKLRTWPALPPTIEECYLSSNHYMRLPDLSAFENLIVLELNDNSIEGIVNPLPPRLARLNLECNAIRTFNAPVPTTCLSISTNSNPLNPFGHRLVRAGVRRGGAAVAAGLDAEGPPAPTVYVNGQNVHDSGIQDSTKKNILYLVDYRPEVPENPGLWDIINAAYAPQSVKSSTCCGTSSVVTPSPYAFELPGSILANFGKNPYIMHGVTFTRLVDRIWLRITDVTDAERKQELMRRFREETEEGKEHCTNGMMVRMSNVFLGFDEKVAVKLNANQVLSARIPATQDRLRKSMGAEAGPEGREVPAFWVAVYKETIKDLEELEQKEEDWAQWLQPIAEIVLDDLFEKQGWKGLPKSSRPSSLQEHIQSTGLHGFPFEIEYLTGLWSDQSD